MAERRMFAKTIIDSDAFLDMPLTAQALYFHLAMRADDEGFINNPKKIQRMLGCSDDDSRLLIAKQFLLPFESGVLVVKHWRIHNYIQRDRSKDTLYKNERKMLIVNEDKSYDIARLDTTCIQPSASLDTDCIQNGYKMDTTCIQPSESLDTQVRLGKVRLGKDREIYMRHQYGAYKNVLLTDEEIEKLKNEFDDWEKRIERLSEYMASTGKTYKSHLATIRSWARRDKKTAGAQTLKVVDELADFIERGGKDEQHGCNSA